MSRTRSSTDWDRVPWPFPFPFPCGEGRAGLYLEVNGRSRRAMGSSSMRTARRRLVVSPRRGLSGTLSSDSLISASGFADEGRYERVSLRVPILPIFSFSRCPSRKDDDLGGRQVTGIIEGEREDGWLINVYKYKYKQFTY